MNRQVQIYELLESYPCPPGIELWRVPNIAPEGYRSMSAGSVDEGGQPTSTQYAYFRKDQSNDKTIGYLVSSVEITADMSIDEIREACATAIQLLEEL